MRAILSTPKRCLTVSSRSAWTTARYQRVHRPSRGAQHGARSGQGRHPLPSRRHARRGEGAGVVDDLEVRVPRPAVRRRQGRRGRWIRTSCRMGELERLTRRYASEILPLIGPGAGHPGARRVHRRADHGVDHGHLQHDQGRDHARRRDRQAGGARRLARAATRPPRAASSSCCARRAASAGIKLKGAKVAIQGFGNAGGTLATLLHEDGARIVAASDSQWRHLRPEGARSRLRCTRTRRAARA